MILLIHGAIGASCGVLLRRRSAAILAGLASHFVLDAVNHEEPFDARGALSPGLLAIDAALSGAAWLSVAAWAGVSSPASLGVLAACLPDTEHLLARRRRFSPLHGLFPHARYISPGMNLACQFAVGSISWLALLGWCATSAGPRRAIDIGSSGERR